LIVGRDDPGTPQIHTNVGIKITARQGRRALQSQFLYPIQHIWNQFPPWNSHRHRVRGRIWNPPLHCKCYCPRV